MFLQQCYCKVQITSTTTNLLRTVTSARYFDQAQLQSSNVCVLLRTTIFNKKMTAPCALRYFRSSMRILNELGAYVQLHFYLHAHQRPVHLISTCLLTLLNKSSRERFKEHVYSSGLPRCTACLLECWTQGRIAWSRRGMKRSSSPSIRSCCFCLVWALFPGINIQRNGVDVCQP